MSQAVSPKTAGSPRWCLVPSCRPPQWSRAAARRPLKWCRPSRQHLQMEGSAGCAILQCSIAMH
eukprot:9258749-Karenia_brevis.AAC.1